VNSTLSVFGGVDTVVIFLLFFDWTCFLTRKKIQTSKMGLGNKVNLPSS
jgi:hypothetical protein